MESYSVEISRTAERQIRKLSRDDQVRVVSAIKALGHDPRPRGYRKLKVYDDVFRIRIGTFRVIYAIEGRGLIVIILKVGQRRDVYR